MRLWKLTVSLACGLFAGTAMAQNAGVYVMLSGQRVGNIAYDGKNLVSSAPSQQTIAADGYATGVGDFYPLGGAFGGYYDFLQLGRFRVGADVRGSLSSAVKGTGASDLLHSGSGGKLYTVLGGARIVYPFVTRHVPMEAYAMGSAGLARSNYGVTDASYAGTSGLSNSVAYVGSLGLDIRMATSVDLRIEGGYGGLSGGPVSRTYDMQTYSVGIVFHPRREAIRR